MFHGGDSHPRLPAHPGSAQHVGVCGLVQQTVHLLLHRQAVSWKLGTDVVLFHSQGDRLHPAEGFVFLEAELQLLAEGNQMISVLIVKVLIHQERICRAMNLRYFKTNPTVRTSQRDLCGCDVTAPGYSGRVCSLELSTGKVDLLQRVPVDFFGVHLPHPRASFLQLL